jgi:hypothetical protein
MVGNIININNMMNRIFIAQENEDPELMYFILGKIFYYVARFDPIEIASLNGNDDASLGSIISLITALVTY